MDIRLTATTLVLTPQTTGVFLLVYSVAFAAAVWSVFAAIGIATSAHHPQRQTTCA
jgi:hypothetical protein